MDRGQLAALAVSSLVVLTFSGCSGSGAQMAAPAATAVPSQSSATPSGNSATVPAAATTPASSSVIASLNSATTQAAAIVSPKVVEIQSAGGLGSGEIYDPRGFIVTNFHVLSGGGTSLQPPFTVTLSNGATFNASVAGTDSADDLAVLKINAAGLSPIALGDSSKLQVGQFVLAVGNPLGFAQTVTFGIVSTLNRGVPEGQPAAFLPNLIQTSAPINPGNSGGALVDLQGRLIGIPTLAAQDPQMGGAAQGIGFAIPVNRVIFIANQIVQTGKVANSGRAFLGITPLEITPQVQAQYRLPVNHGVLVFNVVAGGPAAKAGLKQGDIIESVNGKTVNTLADLLDTVASLGPGQQVKLGVLHANGGTSTVTVTLGTLPVS
jgi:S1-C subfamily serine protease